jgi:hypothetical protein
LATTAQIERLTPHESYVVCGETDTAAASLYIHVPRKALAATDPTLFGNPEYMDSAIMRDLCDAGKIPRNPRLFIWQQERPVLAVYPSQKFRIKILSDK